jgi:hypothetical protein
LTQRRLLLALGLAALLFRLQFIAHDMRDLVTRGPLYDDSFYCFEIARNIARGLGSTVDGVHATNGYQPLYVLLLVPLYWIWGGDATGPIYSALVASAVLNVLTGWILFRLVRRYASPVAAFFALLLWSFGPAIVRQSVNGLETSLAMLLLAAALEYYLAVYRPRPSPGRRETVTLGALLGLAILARIDALLFVAAIGFDVLRHRRPHAVRRLVATGIVAGAVLLPWCVASLRLSGTVLPQSGEATRFLSAAYAEHDHPELAGSTYDEAPGLFLLGNVVRSVLQLGTSPVVQIYARGLERVTRPLAIDSPSNLYTLTALLALAAFVIVLAARRTRVDRPWVYEEFGFLIVYCVLLVAAYSFYVFGMIFYSRYYYPIFFLSIVLGAFAFDLLLRLVGPARRGIVAGALLAVYGIALPYMTQHRVTNGNYRFLRVVDWIETHTPPGATIGVFNSGAIAYFSDRHIVNLDGKVNPAALAALRGGRIVEYLGTENIEYVIDHEWILSRFLLGATSGKSLGFARVDAQDRELGVPGWRAYRVERPAESASGGSGVASRLSH